ncbi:MAG: DUF86 domain-containing protein [Nanoarchaeota archaeon]|nr:DUF86 domain-containing protein [Nanoarchaeota archaeon]
MKREECIFIKDILEQIMLIQRFTKNVPKEMFERDLNLRDATIRRLEIIGEAVKNISKETKHKYPKIKWKNVSGTRDILIHAYFGVDMDLIWKAVKVDIPILKKQMQKILKDLNQQV